MLLTHAFLFVVALLGGALNSVAGGGSFIALPALIYAGVSPVAANATTTFALWPGSVASAIAYRREISTARRWIVPLGAVSLVGGLLGGELLMRTSDTRFLQLLPWLMLAAVVTFTFGSTITGRIRGARRGLPATGAALADATRAPEASRSGGAERAGTRLPVWILVLQLLIATYGGYFGGGMGIMMLAAFAVVGMTDIHEMNGLKVILAVVTNGVALAAFVMEGAVVWGPGLVMVAGSITGGYLGAFLARQVGTKAIRACVVGVGWVMTIYFFAR